VRRSTTPRPSPGGNRKALNKELGKARGMTNILAAQSAETIPSCTVRRGDMRGRSVPIIGSVMHITISEWAAAEFKLGNRGSKQAGVSSQGEPWAGAGPP
jgi:hypothetical protein